jgi:hypothetical protein
LASKLPSLLGPPIRAAFWNAVSPDLFPLTTLIVGP